MYQRIVVGIDGSAHGEHALRHARARRAEGERLLAEAQAQVGVPAQTRLRAWVMLVP
jgi:nucleotide-binding universal stress UspA family protein